MTADTAANLLSALRCSPTPLRRRKNATNTQDFFKLIKYQRQYRSFRNKDTPIYYVLYGN